MAHVLGDLELALPRSPRCRLDPTPRMNPEAFVAKTDNKLSRLSPGYHTGIHAVTVFLPLATHKSRARTTVFNAVSLFLNATPTGAVKKIHAPTGIYTRRFKNIQEY